MKQVWKRYALMAAIGAIAGTTTLAAQAATETAQKRVPMRSIDETSVVDEKTILMKLKDKTYKRVDLQATCPGLTMGHGFIHTTNTDEWTVYDTIRVNYPGGATCTIDKIVNIDDTEAKTLLAAKR